MMDLIFVALWIYIIYLVTVVAFMVIKVAVEAGQQLCDKWGISR
jgi:hypothetical protein